MSLFEVENSTEVLKQFKRNIINERIPINANIFLTNKCNFKCLHCYVQSQKNIDANALEIGRWKRIVDVLKEKGCISITFSGGEVLASDKFVELYKYAYDLNFCISLLTNISLLSEEHLKVFVRRKPQEIIITLYGTSNDTYSQFCGIQRGWEIVRDNILRLKSENINVKIQTVVNKINFNELKDMKKFADTNKISFTAFRTINCEIDGNVRPMQYQISTQQEILSFDILEDGDDFLKAVGRNTNMWNSGYKRCFAGLTNCYIDYKGNLFLCNHSAEKRYNILELGFDNAWERIYGLRKREIEKTNECSACRNRAYCGKCTPTFRKIEKATGFPFHECDKTEEIKRYLSESKRKGIKEDENN